MPPPTLNLAGRKYVVIPQSEYRQLKARAARNGNAIARARRQTEDDYWIEAALKAEADARERGEKAIPFEQVEDELDSRKRSRRRRRR